MIKIAYIIVAHHHPEHLCRLINRLDCEGVHFFIHINKKMEEMYRILQEALADYQNCTFIEQVPIKWGDFGMVQALLNGISEICERELDIDFVISLSGQDYPIQTNQKINQTLAKYSGQQLMEYFSLPYSKWGKDGGCFKYEKFHFWFLDRHCRFVPSHLDRFLPFKRRMPFHLKAYGGSAWWCLTKGCIHYINQLVHSEQGKKICSFFKHTIGAPEIFFQTLILNSPFANTVINLEITEIHWKTDASHPSVWTQHDFGKLKNSNRLFARKFDTVESAEILDLLDAKAQAENVENSALRPIKYATG